MADDSSQTPRPFDVQTVKYLIRLMGKHDLSEVDLSEGDQRIRLRRGPRGGLVMPAPTAYALPAPAAAPAAAAPAAAPKAEAPAAPQKQLIDIKSPTPGTFYSKPKPDADTYVRKGAKVTPTTVVCLIEAMKLFTEITADCTGVIAEILVENQQPVEYNQVLFRVDPTGG
ncbi:MAG: acetyl-CoA carboxylase biotin carboxyl carrier protein [Planctomycetia bacterium]|nr:acetyl-CoA carboxylase biotin carboxyl carrier protein [Planctomycetia bacterium]